MSTSILLTRVLLLLSAGAVLSLAVVYRRQTWRILHDFFRTPGDPLNLAVLRIVVFGAILYRVDLETILWYSRLPAELLVPPPGLGPLLAIVPINELWARASTYLLVAACVTGLVGFFSRTSALLVVVLGFYALGITQFYGKIAHFNHLLWIGALLAVAPCGARLSVDAVLASWKRADAGNTAPPGPHVAYSLPLRFVWLFIGIIYFFPGFWKAWSIGIGWAWSDNLRLIMYQKWSEFGDWAPLFRVDHFPTLVKLSGVATILFELSFILLIFFSAGRVIAFVSGLLFHNMTFAFMRISFWHLQVVYISLVDWARVCRALGSRLFREHAYLLYDGQCRRCRRAVASARVFDVLGTVTYLDLHDREAHAREVRLIVGRRTFAGWRAYRALAHRIPVFWPVLPLLYLLPVGRLGEAISRRFPGERTGPIASPVADGALEMARLRRSYLAVGAVGAVLAGANAAAGVLRIDSWPIAVYPTFAYRPGPTFDRVAVRVVSPTGSQRDVSFDALFGDQAARTSARAPILMTRILASADEEARRRRLNAFLDHWLAEQGATDSVSRVVFTRETYTTHYHAVANQLLRSEVMYELELLPGDGR